MKAHYLIFLLLSIAHLYVAAETASYVTQTIYGFLDFTTTIENTVMVFSPQSAPPVKETTEPPTTNVIETKPITKTTTTEPTPDTSINPTKIESNDNQISSSTTVETSKEADAKTTTTTTSTAPTTTTTTTSKEAIIASTFNIVTPSITTVVATSKKEPFDYEESNSLEKKDTALTIDNNRNQPEYDLLSRQPAEYAEETYKIVNLKSARPSEKPRLPAIPKKSKFIHSNDAHRSVESLTNHESSIVGTYISGKYAQVPVSSSQIYKQFKPKVDPTSTLRVLKTVSPLTPKKSGKSPYRPTTPNRSGPKNNNNENKSVVIAKSSNEPINENNTGSNGNSGKKSSNRRKSKRRNKTSRPSSSAQTNNRKNLATKIQPSTTETDLSTSLYTFKLNRTPGRWQYKSSPKPRVNIRKHANDNPIQQQANTTIVTPLSIQDSIIKDSQNLILEQGDLESSGSQSGAVLNNINNDNNKPNLFIETLNVEISTPADFSDTYFEIATLKTPFTFQAGVVKKTRYVTITSTITKTLTPEPSTMLASDEPLMENILAPTTRYNKIIGDSSITTLQPIYLTDDYETPSLETITESFSIVQTKLRTQILPIINTSENRTSYISLIHTYDFTSLITATKTLSPLDANQFIPSKSFTDISANLDEAGSEINLELEFGDEDNNEDFRDDKDGSQQQNGYTKTPIESTQVHKLPNPINNHETDLLQQQLQQQQQQQQLQQQQLNIPNPNMQSVITATRPVIKQETLWESHVVPLVNGASTIYRTLSKSVGVYDKTDFVTDYTTINLQPPPQPLFTPSLNPFLLPQSFQTITSSIIHQTIATQTNSKVLKLTFGAKTAYTTIYSTQVMPTALTMLITTSIPVQPTASFPGFYPPPYPPYYVG